MSTGIKRGLKIFTNGLSTGLFLQLAIGPVFLYIINLAMQRTIYDGLIAVLAVTLVDFFYITLSVIGIGKILENKKNKNLFGIIGSIVLIIFGIVILHGALNGGVLAGVEINSKNLVSSFASTFILTISNPLTILFFTGIFSVKAVEYNYTKNDLYIFGFSVGLATMIFMSTAVIIFLSLKEAVPTTLIETLNIIVGIVLICYGTLRIIKIFKKLINKS